MHASAASAIAPTAFAMSEISSSGSFTASRQRRCRGSFTLRRNDHERTKSGKMFVILGELAAAGKGSLATGRNVGMLTEEQGFKAVVFGPARQVYRLDGSVGNQSFN